MRLFPHQLRAGLGALAVVFATTADAHSDAPSAESKPEFAQALNNLGLALRDMGRHEAAAAALQKAIELDPKNALIHKSLGLVLKDQGRLDEAMAECKKAIELDPKFSLAHNNLAGALRDTGHLDEAVTEYKKAIELDPTDATPHYGLGNVLSDKDRLDEAIAEYKKAIELDPKDAGPHLGLGYVLQEKGKSNEAIVEYKKAIKLDPKDAASHFNLGYCLQDLSRLDEAVAEYKKVIELYPKSADAHSYLGHALIEQGRFTEARQAFQRCRELLPAKQLVSRGVATAHLQLCEHMIALDEKLKDYLTGEARPANAEEQIALAQLCRFKKRFAAAVRFYNDVFAAKPNWADDLDPDHPYYAACCAVLAAAGQGEDAAKLDDKERAHLRKQALDWLRAGLTLWRKKVEKGNPKEHAEAQKTLRHWQQDPSLAQLRDDAALDKLPETERAACRELWNDVDALLKK